MQDSRTIATEAGIAAGQARPAIRPLKLVAIALGVAVALGLPFMVGDFRSFQLTQAIIYAIALLGLNMLTGYNGQISLGHGAFFAIGAYTTAILIDKLGVPYYATLPVAGIICFVIGFLFGLPALRLEGLYLALATLALALAVPQLLRFKPLEGLTDGVQGITLEKPAPPFGLPITPDQWLYFFALIVAVIMFWAGHNMLKGRIGRAMIAIRDHHISAETMGINTALIKSTTFGVSALYTGVAGALSAVVVAFVAPDSFELFLSISLLVGMVIGGLASVSGAIYGGLFVQFVPNIAEEVSKAAPWAIYGVVLILFMYFMPTGVAGFVRRAQHWLRKRLAGQRAGG
jgi:branched-chain amino acid transport system permease protein